MKACETSSYPAIGLQDTVIWDGLDRLGMGLFRLNEEGYITQFNAVAAGILALDRYGVWDDLHISKVDRVLATGLADQFEDVINGSLTFVRKNLSCTNSRGRFMVVNLVGIPIRSDENAGKEVLGIVEDCAIAHHEADDPSNVHQQLRILSEVAAALSSSFELGQILKIILTGATASQGLGFNRTFLFLYDEEADKLRGHMAVGPSSAEEAGRIWKRLDSMRLSLSELLDAHQSEAGNGTDALTSLIADLHVDLNGDSLISSACKSGTWINLEKVEEIDPVTTTFVEKLGTPRIALVPMVSKGTLMGLLAADNYITQQSISDDAVQLLQVLANQAAVAMERAKLYDAERERAELLERMNLQLAESQDQIIKIEKMSVIGELTSAVAHELRNPLTIVGGFANLLLKSNLTDEQREYLNIISSEIKRTESVVDHVLDFSRASKNENRPIELSGLVERNLELLRGRLRQRNVEMSLSLAQEKLMVHGNPDQLSHAVYQMLKLVAEDVIPPGTAEVRTERRDERACLLIKFFCPDDGKEKTIKALKQIFAGNKASQRLTVLVAVETIKYHGGEFGLAVGNDSLPYLYIELPLIEEDQSEPAHIDRR